MNVLLINIESTPFHRFSSPLSLLAYPGGADDVKQNTSPVCNLENRVDSWWAGLMFVVIVMKVFLNLLAKVQTEVTSWLVYTSVGLKVMQFLLKNTSKLSAERRTSSGKSCLMCKNLKLSLKNTVVAASIKYDVNRKMLRRHRTDFVLQLVRVRLKMQSGAGSLSINIMKSTLYKKFPAS